MPELETFGPVQMPTGRSPWGDIGATPDFPSFDGSPTTVLAIADTPGSPTHELARSLWQTGVLGAPMEYFDFDHVSFSLIVAWRTPHWEFYVQELKRRRTSPNGVFSVVLSGGDILRLSLLGVDVTPTHVVRMRSEDQSRHVGETFELHAEWEAWCDRLHGAQLVVTNEDFRRDPEAVVHAIRNWLDGRSFEPSVASDPLATSGGSGVSARSWFSGGVANWVDLPEFGGEVTTFVVASSPRSGSNVFCEALARTGRLGAPIEYFNLGTCVQLVMTWGAGSLADYGRAMVRRRTTSNGVFGLKLHYNQCEALMSKKVSLDPTAWVMIERADVVAQGVSLAKAMQTRAWNSFGRAAVVPAYDFGQIAVSVQFVRANNAGWERYFDERGISPLRFLYEEVVMDPDASAQRVIELLMLGDDTATEMSTPHYLRQSDQTNEEWIALYRLQCRRRGIDAENPEL